MANVATHIAHIEELILKYGEKGALSSIKYLTDLIEEFSGAGKKTNISVKMDGAPALLFSKGIQEYPFPFIAMKTAFESKSPKIFNSIEALQAEYGERAELLEKMVGGFTALQYLNIPKNTIWKGDVLFSINSKERITVEGKNYISFKPNQIMYAVDATSDLAKRIEKTPFGIVFHTSYSGSTLLECTGNERFNFSLEKGMVTNELGIFAVDANAPDITQDGGITQEEKAQLLSRLQDGKELISTIGHVHDMLNEETLIKDWLAIYENSKIRKGYQFKDSEINDIIEFFTNKFEKEKSKYKTEKKIAQIEELKFKTLTILEEYGEDIETLITFQNIIVSVKDVFIKKLNKLSHLIPMVQNDDEYEFSTHEGFVLSGTDSQVVKLVDRLDFSFRNFTNMNFSKKPDETITESIFREKDVNTKEPLDMTSVKSLLKDLDATVRGKEIPDIDYGKKYTVVDNKFGDRKELATELSNALPIENELTHDAKSVYRPIIKFSNGTVLEFKDGKISRGSQSTASNEIGALIACYNLIEENREATESDLPPDINKGMFNSALNTAKVIKDYVGSANYTYHHPNTCFNSDFVELPDSENIFKRLFSIAKENKIAKKDTWNPADIYLVKEGFTVPDELHALQEVNEYLKERLIDKTIVGISLKKTGKVAILDEINLEEVQYIPLELKAFSLKFDIAEDFKSSRQGALLIFNSEKDLYKLNIRKFIAEATSKVLCELQRKGDKAMGGKLAQNIVASLYEEMNSYLPTLQDLKEWNTSENKKQFIPQFLELAENIIQYVPCDINLESVENYFNTIIDNLNPINTLDYNTKIQCLYFGNMFANVIKQGMLNEVLNVFKNSSAKKGAEYAPYLLVH